MDVESVMEYILKMSEILPPQNQLFKTNQFPVNTAHDCVNYCKLKEKTKIS
jgi:hypothetical protein